MLPASARCALAASANALMRIATNYRSATSRVRSGVIGKHRPIGVRRRNASYSVAVTAPRLVFLYGPPAVGKLTVARAIAAREPFRILHNHLTIDPVTEVLPFGTDAFWRVVGQFRRHLVATAAAEGLDLIYTYVFAPGDEQHVADITLPFQQVGGRVVFVRLHAPREVLLQRVREQSRREHRKVTDTATLERLLDQYEGFTAGVEGESLIVENALTSAEEAAGQILDHLALQRDA